jgi:hypothetical protein
MKTIASQEDLRKCHCLPGSGQIDQNDQEVGTKWLMVSDLISGSWYATSDWSRSGNRSASPAIEFDDIPPETKR